MKLFRAILMLILFMSLNVYAQYYQNNYPNYPYQQNAGSRQVSVYNQWPVNPSTNILQVNPHSDCPCSSFCPYPYSVQPENNYPTAGIPNINKYFMPSSPININYVQRTPNVDSKSISVNDKYANLKTDVINVNPVEFNQHMESLNTQPRIIATYTEPVQQHTSVPQYIVKTETRKSNYTNQSLPVSRHEVSHKMFSFNRTYVITPENRNAVVNLNFINGQPINVDDVKEKYNSTTSKPTTTEESEIPDNIYKFITTNGSVIDQI